MSSQVLWELCRGKTAESLPPELRQFATMEVIEMKYPSAATQPLVTHDQPRQIQNSIQAAITPS